MEIASAIIVAAGAGKRMGANVPKQFIKINDKTILEHTLEAFIKFNLFNEIVIVLSEDYVALVKEMLENYPNQTIKICMGGKERFHSVKNALQIVNAASEIVFIHDAVRPFCTVDLANACFKDCLKNGSAIPAVQIKDSIRKIEKNGKSKIVDRSNLRSIQTPQVFNFNKIKAAYNTEFSSSFTDDASVYEAAKNKIHLVTGESFNIKITTPDDIAFARLWLSR